MIYPDEMGQIIYKTVDGNSHNNNLQIETINPIIRVPKLLFK